MFNSSHVSQETWDLRLVCNESEVMPFGGFGGTTLAFGRVMRVIVSASDPQLIYHSQSELDIRIDGRDQRELECRSNLRNISQDKKQYKG